MEDHALTLSLVRGLLGEVHPELRAASAELDASSFVVRLRFEYDGEPSCSARDSCSCAATEVIADFPASWSLDEQHVVSPRPQPVKPLALLAYRRWEPEDAA
jgi:hypothetical protein